MRPPFVHRYGDLVIVDETAAARAEEQCDMYGHEYDDGVCRCCGDPDPDAEAE